MLPIPLRKINKSFVSKLAKNGIPNIIKSINFLPIWKQNFCWFFSRVLTTKYFILHRFKIDPQKGFFYTPHPWGKSTKVFFQKWQKTAYQTSSNRSILMVFDRFNDVWYAVFCQFWNKTFVNFLKGIDNKIFHFT